MPIGAMRERVTLQVEHATGDGLGGYALAWVTLAEVYARVTPISGREAMSAEKVEEQNSYRITIRARSDITGKSRALWKSRELNIRSIQNYDERGRYLQLTCDEGMGT